MRIEKVSPGDIVQCSIGGRRIYGEVLEIKDGTVHFKPISPAAGWRHATARQIVGHWRKTGRIRGGAEVGVADEGEGTSSTRSQPREQLSLPLHS